LVRRWRERKAERVRRCPGARQAWFWGLRVQGKRRTGTRRERWWRCEELEAEGEARRGEADRLIGSDLEWRSEGGVHLRRREWGSGVERRREGCQERA